MSYLVIIVGFKLLETKIKEESNLLLKICNLSVNLLHLNFYSHFRFELKS